ncbi:MAG: hypothetical protein CVU97_05410 [Firmicutes bacterium HGW-Firmicutes-21]|nr:MAG: hypothetical protein CVU97_05410 [Firmicutes bacterium HGW-Firmicutes-21]
MERYVIDRIEGDYVVCLDENDNSVDIPLHIIGIEVREGMYLLCNDGRYTPETELTEQVIIKNKDRLNTIFNRNKK